MTLGNLTSGEMTFGKKTFGEMTFGELPFSKMTLGDLTFGEMASSEMTFGETPGNRTTENVVRLEWEWEIQDGGLPNQINLYLSLHGQDRNQIPMAITMFSRSSYPMGLFAMLRNQTGRNQKWKIQDGGLQPWNTFISACMYTR